MSMLRRQRVLLGVLILLALLVLCGFYSRATEIKNSWANLRWNHPSKRDMAEKIYITVKTSTKYHKQRLAPLLVTWMQRVKPHQVHVITDKRISNNTDKWLLLSKALGFSFHHANCSFGHTPDSLCCKTGVEFDYYYKAIEEGNYYDWFCHFDDDMYVNYPHLVTLLGKYNPYKEYCYIGRHPWPDSGKAAFIRSLPKMLKPYANTFRYAGGPVYCISLKLMQDVESYLRGQNFSKTCKEFGIGPVDEVVGTVVQITEGHNFTEDVRFRFQKMMDISSSEYKDQITLNLKGFNVPNATFSKEVDPTRYLSFHCSLYPDTDWCKMKIHSVDDVSNIISKEKRSLHNFS